MIAHVVIFILIFLYLLPSILIAFSSFDYFFYLPLKFSINSCGLDCSCLFRGEVLFHFINHRLLMNLKDKILIRKLFNMLVITCFSVLCYFCSTFLLPFVFSCYSYSFLCLNFYMNMTLLPTFYVSSSSSFY